MQAFNIPDLQGTKPVGSDVIYFSCNKDYYYRFGVPLINSIIHTVDFLCIHIHLVLKPEDICNINITRHGRITYTHEVINNEFLSNIPINHSRINEGKVIWNTDNELDVIEKTYYASARFMRLDELFTDSQYIFQIDCDSILRNKFTQNDYRRLTADVRLMPKPKDPDVIIASSVCLGQGTTGKEFRSLFSQKLKDAFATGAYWYVDQDVLKEVAATTEWKTIPFVWNSWKIATYDFFITGKGDRKDKDKFKRVQEHWQSKGI
jgi:hypothetical protein